MIPLFFGDSKSPLFGMLHEPRAGQELGQGVLMCPPIGQEHVRSHWAFRQVAAALARAGYHVLRFEWYGVGDSAGTLDDASVERWVDDAKTAAQELKDAAGVRKVSMLGLRLGAPLAALAAPSVKPQALVLWDAVVDGGRYLAELRRLQAALIADERRFWFAWPSSVRSTVGRVRADVAQERHAASDELVGFHFRAELLDQIAAVGPDAYRGLKRSRVVVVDSPEAPGAAELVPPLEAAGLTVERIVTEASGRWADPRQVEELLLPADAVAAITRALSGQGST